MPDERKKQIEAMNGKLYHVTVTGTRESWSGLSTADKDFYDQIVEIEFMDGPLAGKNFEIEVRND